MYTLNTPLIWLNGSRETTPNITVKAAPFGRWTLRDNGTIGDRPRFMRLNELTMKIEYSDDAEISVELAIDLYKRSTLGERRPIDRPDIFAGMLSFSEL
jgi:hypothetical protein